MYICIYMYMYTCIHVYVHVYIQPIPLGVTFSKAQSSKLESLLCHVSVKRDVRALSFETAFENVTPSGIGCSQVAAVPRTTGYVSKTAGIGQIGLANCPNHFQDLQSVNHFLDQSRASREIGNAYKK